MEKVKTQPSPSTERRDREPVARNELEIKHNVVINENRMLKNLVQEMKGKSSILMEKNTDPENKHESRRQKLSYAVVTSTKDFQKQNVSDVIIKPIESQNPFKTKKELYTHVRPATLKN